MQSTSPGGKCTEMSTWRLTRTFLLEEAREERERDRGREIWRRPVFLQARVACLKRGELARIALFWKIFFGDILINDGIERGTAFEGLGGEGGRKKKARQKID